MQKQKHNRIVVIGVLIFMVAGSSFGYLLVRFGVGFLLKPPKIVMISFLIIIIFFKSQQFTTNSSAPLYLWWRLKIRIINVFS